MKNRDIPLLGIKVFDTQNFLKHRRVPLRNDSVLGDKTVLTENRDARPSLIPNVFRYEKFSETQKGSSTKFFDTVRQKFLNGKS